MTTYKELFDQYLDEESTIPTAHSFAVLLEKAFPEDYEKAFKEYVTTGSYLCVICDEEFRLTRYPDDKNSETICGECEAEDVL